jgi:hypothetical protein
MSVSLVRVSFIFVLSLGVASLAGAQSLGSFTWQLQPYCNILTLNVTQTGGTYALDGFDDQCGASSRASATGTAFLNPDGTIGIGVSIVTAPGGTPIHVDATISLATLSGSWRDSHYLSGDFAFGASSAIASRPSFDETVAAWAIDKPARVLGIRANGSREAPLQVFAGQKLALFAGAAYGLYGSAAYTASMEFSATETWTANGFGSKIDFFTAPNGSINTVHRLAIAENGNVGIGTQSPADRLDVFGDIRVGTGIANGCLKHHGGNALIGTCSSDARFKRDITPFVAVLERVAALRPVHYYWRSAEFPEKAFGTQQAYGLIAQDVTEVLPELVVTGADGYMAVDYAKLPLLAIQAIKELKEKNDALERRLAAIEGVFSRLSAERQPR